MKVSSSGGTPQALTNVLAARGRSWGRRNVIIYSPDAGSSVWRINPDGTGAAPLTDAIRTADDNTHRWPVFLPDGDHFLFWGGNFGVAKDDQTNGIYVSSLAGKERKRVILCRSSFAYDSGHLYFANQDQHLVSMVFDPSTATVSGGPTAIADVVGFQASTYWAAITASENGTLIFNTSTGAALSALTWMDRSGRELGRVGVPAVQANPSISADGSRIAVDISDPKENNVDIWLESAAGAGNTRFTFDPGEEVIGVWSRDGSMLAYRANLSRSALVLKRATGLEKEQVRFGVPSSDDILPNSWSPDNRQILCTHQIPSGSHLLLVPLTGGPPTPFVTSKGNDVNGQISADGKWVAYASDESGNWEIYVTTFPGAAGKWQVSRGGGTEPRWRGDGKEIFYLGPRGTLTAVPVDVKDTFSTGTPTPLFQFHGRAPISSTDLFSYDVSKDGTRFLVDRYLKPEHPTPLTIVLNITAESRR
jgi:Tol biopolymer transport system component